MWAKLSDKSADDPRIEALGNEGWGAFCRMLAHCTGYLTDGRVAGGKARYIARPAVIERLLEYGFLLPKGDGYVIPNYLDYNPSREQVEEKRAKDRSRKRVES